jgi:hypothetical protein
MPAEQLQVMVKNLRSECGHSLSVAQGVNSIDTLKYLLQRTQEELWTAFSWPDLTIRADIPLLAGQFRYSFPTTMAFDQIRESWSCRPSDSTWTPVGYGISEDMIKPGGDNAERADTVECWGVEGAQSDTPPNNVPMVRVFPTPDTNGSTLRFKGNRPLKPFVADADLCTLDDNTIVLFCAAEILARAKAEDAPGKLQKAERHLLKILGDKISAKNKVSTLGGGSPARRFTSMGPLNRSSMFGS